jgi:hypothetical protein
MRLGDTNKLLIFLVWFGVWLPTECFVRMRSSSLWQRRFIRVEAISTFRNGSNSNTRVPLLAALAHQPSSSFESSYRRHARLFATSVPITMMDEHNNEAAAAASGEDQCTDYEKWVRRLYMTNMFHPVKMGLTNMRQLHNLLGNPMDDVRWLYCVQTFLLHFAKHNRDPY